MMTAELIAWAYRSGHALPVARRHTGVHHWGRHGHRGHRPHYPRGCHWLFWAVVVLCLILGIWGR